MNDTTVRSFMYEQVSRDCFIRFICCLAVSLKFNSWKYRMQGSYSFWICRGLQGQRQSRTIFETANVDKSINRPSKAARLSNLGPRHSIWEPDDSEDMDLRGSFIEKRFRSNSVAGSDWFLFLFLFRWNYDPCYSTSLGQGFVDGRNILSQR